MPPEPPPAPGAPPPPVGAVFTPAPWARFAVRRFGLVGRWMAGATVLDPSLGTGNLLEALADTALEDGIHPRDLPFDRLRGFEVVPGFRDQAVETFRRKYGADMEDRFAATDLFDSDLRADVLFGNPPWGTFADLPAGIKDRYRPLFVRYGLAPDTRSLLLGGSRIDLAALVVQKTLADNLVPGGEAFFFLPLSLFFGDGAHRAFRGWTTGPVPFAPLRILDFHREKAFAGVATRYGLAAFRRDSRAAFPIPCERLERGRWVPLEAAPVFAPDDPLSLGPPGTLGALPVPEKIPVPRRSKPRQGVNTGGANKVFFFDRPDPDNPVPRAYLHPLITAVNFRDPQAPPAQWVLLPYDEEGRPLSPGALGAEPGLKAYLDAHRAALESRRGVLVGALVRRGLWWGLLGVGPYSFAPWKVVWEAYGRDRFRPRIFEGRWQVNQSLQAYIPCWSRDEADRILTALAQPAVEAYLLSLTMAGTMSWAQPGRVARLLDLR